MEEDMAARKRKKKKSAAPLIALLLLVAFAIGALVYVYTHYNVALGKFFFIQRAGQFEIRQRFVRVPEGLADGRGIHPGGAGDDVPAHAKCVQKTQCLFHRLAGFGFFAGFAVKE